MNKVESDEKSEEDQDEEEPIFSEDLIKKYAKEHFRIYAMIDDASPEDVKESDKNILKKEATQHIYHFEKNVKKMRLSRERKEKLKEYLVGDNAAENQQKMAKYVKKHNIPGRNTKERIKNLTDAQVNELLARMNSGGENGD